MTDRIRTTDSTASMPPATATPAAATPAAAASDPVPTTRRESRTITIDVPSSATTLGLAPIISLLLLFGAWMVVGIGYICVPGSLLGAVAGVVLGFMNVGNGLAAAALCFGCGIAGLGLCAPIFYGTRFLHGLVKRQSKDMFAQASGK